MGCSALFLLACVLVSAHGLCVKDIAPIALRNIGQFPHGTWRVNVSFIGGDGRLVPLFDHLGGAYSVPASVNKMFTTAAAYLTLGEQFTTQSRLYRTARGLCLQTGGDATLSHADLLRLVKTIAPLLPKNESMALEVDDSLFGSQDVPNDWEWSDMFYDYGAPPTPSVLQENTVVFSVAPGSTVDAPAVVSFNVTQDNSTVTYLSEVVTTAAGSGVNLDTTYRLRDPHTVVLLGTIALDAGPQFVDPAVHNPGLRLARALANHLKSVGVTVSSTASSALPLCTVGSAKLIGTITSPMLPPIMNYTLKTSDNLQAELWMRLLALNSVPTNLTNYGTGVQRVKEVLSGVGVNVSNIMQTDGSGLSRSNLVQPNACVDLLHAMANHSTWVSFLPIGGVDGTLSGRFIGTPAEGRVHAKTGSMTGVYALAGYLYAQNFTQPLVFSFIVNDVSDRTDDDVWGAMDNIVVALAELSNC